jgi:hypothetical protein
VVKAPNWPLPFKDPSHPDIHLLGQWHEACKGKRTNDETEEPEELSKQVHPLLFIEQGQVRIVDMTSGSIDEKRTARQEVTNTIQRKKGSKKEEKTEEEAKALPILAKTRLWLQAGDQAEYTDDTGLYIRCLLDSCMRVFKCGKPFNPSNFLTHMDKCGKSQRNILQSTKRSPKMLSQRMSVFFDVVPSPKKMRVTSKSPSDSGNTTSNADGVGKQTVDLSAEDDEKEDPASRNLTTLGVCVLSSNFIQLSHKYYLSVCYLGRRHRRQQRRL